MGLGQNTEILQFVRGAIREFPLSSYSSKHREEDLQLACETSLATEGLRHMHDTGGDKVTSSGKIACSHASRA
jgi:hypothetical protein